MESRTNLIKLERVSKEYRLRRSAREIVGFRRRRAVEALRRVDLRVDAGEIVCLLGRNGAGKTTLLKIISGIVAPDSGSIWINGRNASVNPGVFSSVGLVAGDERGFYWRLSGYENLRFFAYLWGLSGGAARFRIDEVLDVVDLADRGRDEVRTYSSGMKQRLAIARALLSDPPILLIDELARSLDYPSALDLARFIKELVVSLPGRTAIIATHQVWVAREIASRVVVLDDGEVVADGTPEALLNAAAGARFTVYVESPMDVVGAAVASVPDADLEREGGVTRVSFPAPTPSILGAAFGALAKFNILDVTVEGGEISEAFLKLLRGNNDA
jgi:ABC-2 type transport system ATP-binding protein